MAVHVRTTSPHSLNVKLTSALRRGKVDDWSIDDDGDLTLDGSLQNQAWMRPVVGSDRLSFYIVSPRGVRLSVATYAAFHGRLCEALLAHFDKDFDRVESTAMPTGNDAVG